LIFKEIKVTMANSSAFETIGGAKTQFYVSDGFGRDGYIHNNNGGFCPSKEPTRIHGIGKSALPF
jgi:hypothetical protein